MRPLASVPKRMTARNGPSDSSPEGSVGEALRKSQAHFRQLVEGVRDYAIFLLDARGDVASWNQGAERIKGYSADEIIGKHFSTFYPPESIEQGWPEEELQLAKDEGRLEDEGWRVRKDGSRFGASVTMPALRDENGDTEGFLKIPRDLTARKQAEEQSTRLVREQAAREAAEISERRALFLAEASEALAASLDEEEIYQEVVRIAVPFLADICIVDRLEEGFARIAAVNQSSEVSPDVISRLSEYYPIELHDRFLAMLSHELRTPLTPILFSSSLLTEEPTLSETMREHLRVIVKNAQLEARLVDDLLDVTRISRGKFHLNFGIADAHVVLRTVLQTCSADLAHKQLLLSVALEATNNQLQADVDRLQQVFWNLLKNAIKFTSPAVRIAIHP